jgi:hypothetical protein
MHGAVVVRIAEDDLGLEHEQAFRMPHLVRLAVRQADGERLERLASNKLANRIGIHGLPPGQGT